jgi:hypothetical protein
MNMHPLGRDELAPLYPLSRVLGMPTDRFQIQEGTLRGIALFLDDHPDPGHLGLVGQHVDEPRMGNGNEVLVVDPADLHILFPALVVSDDQGTQPFGHHPIHNVPAGRMQVVIHLAVAFVGQSSETMGGVLPPGQESLQVGPQFIVVGIYALERSAVNQKGDDPLLV